MMNHTQAIWLGLVQGLTEFLPVSSSGHLVLGQSLLGLKEPVLLFDICVHVGTCWPPFSLSFGQTYGPLCGDFGPQTARDATGRRLLFLIVAGSMPTAALGLLFKDLFESLFASTAAVGAALLITGFFLLLTRLAPAGNRTVQTTGVARALVVGLAQGLAITPGISRSGITISVGLLLGMDRRLAAHYSFLLSIPAILGALLLQVMHLNPQTDVNLSVLLTGGLVAALSGYFALNILLRVVRAGALHWFAPYCWALGLVALALSYWG